MVNFGLRFKQGVAIYIFCFLFISAVPVVADEVTDVIDEALQQYKAGDYSVAAGNLDYAAQLIRQKTGGKIVNMLPAPLPGWKADDPSSQAVGAAMLGGGVSAERAYSKGNSRVKATIVADSPMLQGLLMMLSNPMFATSNGGKLTKIAGRKAIINYRSQEKGGELQIVVANRFLVTVTGSEVSEKDLKDYASKVEFKGLDNLK